MEARVRELKSQIVQNLKAMRLKETLVEEEHTALFVELDMLLKKVFA
jgi:hypothetical protein